MYNHPFNIRVYGIIINDANEVLISHEHYKEYSFIKFPGGGLEYGEGTTEGLIRECKEEAAMEIKVSDHFYTTDFFQKSVIDSAQIISIYYVATLQSVHEFPLKSDTGFLEFMPIDDALVDTLTLPIDKVVGRKLCQFIQAL